MVLVVQLTGKMDDGLGDVAEIIVPDVIVLGECKTALAKIPPLKSTAAWEKYVVEKIEKAITDSKQVKSSANDE